MPNSRSGPRVKPKTLKPIHPNAGIAATFSRRLRALVEEMHRSVVWWVRAAYRANAPIIAQDATPAAILRAAIRRLTKRWTTRFDEAGTKLGEWFAQAASKRSDAAMKKILKDAGISIDFQITPAMADIAQATVQASVALIKTIPQQHMAAVEGAVMRSVQTGRDVGALVKDLRQIAGVSERRAKFIALDQNNKSTAAFTRARQLENGITKAKWLHSHAGKTPRPTHVEMDGKTYDIAKGMWDRAIGKWILPGTEPRCRCLCRPVIEGFS